MDEEKIITKQRNDMERIIALALVKSLYNRKRNNVGNKKGECDEGKIDCNICTSIY